MHLRRHARGVTSIEYALICVLIAMAALGGVGILGDAVEALYEMVATKMPSMP
ncbi:Flp family type IVb pilin [Cupriavidus sp. Agwp_2]|uniref:Flp family type IVb pilin n=1 Tax=Cupriavidus sp. Agwp_2 TaxID=2897324 RepID=UPI00345F67E5